VATDQCNQLHLNSGLPRNQDPRLTICSQLQFGAGSGALLNLSRLWGSGAINGASASPHEFLEPLGRRWQTPVTVRLTIGDDGGTTQAVKF
jgi:hypothetical protein